jgi:hypothetical protein
MSCPIFSGGMVSASTLGAQQLMADAGGGKQRCICVRMCNRPAAACASACAFVVCGCGRQTTGGERGVAMFLAAHRAHPPAPRSLSAPSLGHLSHDVECDALHLDVHLERADATTAASDLCDAR